MRVVEVPNGHLLVRDASIRLLDTEQSFEDEWNLRLREPITYVVQRPLDSVSFWGGNPVDTLATRLLFTASISDGPGTIQAGKVLRGGATNIILPTTSNGRVLFQVNRDETLATHVFEPCVDIAEYDFGVTSILNEILALSATAPVGKLWVTITNLCCRKNNKAFAKAAAEGSDQDPYTHFNRLAVADVDTLLHELPMFVHEGPVLGLKDRFLRKVASPMITAQRRVTEGDYAAAREVIAGCASEDWHQSVSQWINQVEKS